MSLYVRYVIWGVFSVVAFLRVVFVGVVFVGSVFAISVSLLLGRLSF